MACVSTLCFKYQTCDGLNCSGFMSQQTKDLLDHIFEKSKSTSVEQNRLIEEMLSKFNNFDKFADVDMVELKKIDEDLALSYELMLKSQKAFVSMLLKKRNDRVYGGEE